jgi:VCBS repeat-containing protein
MAFSTPAVVTQVTGRAWIRNSDGSLTELQVGSRIPPDTEIVTASGGTVSLQTDGGMPLTIGENRDVAFNADMAGQPVDRSEAAVAPPTGTDSDRLLAALQSGQDPFDNLDPTAALVAGGGDAGGSSFVRLARIVEGTTPLALEYPGAGVPAINLLTPAGLANTTPDNEGPSANNDQNTTGEKSLVSGNILTNDTDPENDALAIVSVGDRPMTTGGVSVAGSAGGTFTVFPDGSYVFNPGESFQNLGVGQSATSSITYTVTDPSGNTSTATVTVNVNGVNDAPVATSAIDNVAGVDAQQGVNLDVSSHFADVDNGDRLTYSAIGLPPGLVIDPNTGVISGNIDHSASQGGNNGVYQVVVTATDASGASASETFDWSVSNPGPVAVNDTATSTEDTTVSGNVLTGNAQGAGRDSDPDGDTLQVIHAGDRDIPTGGATVAGSNGGTFTILPDGTYTFNPAQDFQSLAAGETRTTTITYIVSDGEGGTSTATLEVTVTGTNDVPVITPHQPTEGDPLNGDRGTVVEDGQLSTQGKLNITDADHDQSFFQAQTNTAGQHGAFSIDADGRWTYNLSNNDPAVQALAVGETLTEQFQVLSADGTPTTITVTIEGTNDIPAISGANAAAVTEDVEPSVSGQLTVADVDASDTHSWSVSGEPKGAYGTISVDQTGKWTYTVDQQATQALRQGQQVQETFNILVSDGHGGTAIQAVTVTITGTNDLPVVTSGSGAVTEDQNVTEGQLVTSGQLTITDADAGEGVFQPGAHFDGSTGNGNAPLGTLAFQADGSYTYTVDNSNAVVQGLRNGESIVETYTVTSQDGTTTSTITITINGTDDAPVITPGTPGGDKGTVQEDVTLSVQGKLDITDADHDQSFFQAQDNAPGKHGTFSVDANGNWTYHLANNDPAVQALAVGEHLTEEFTVLSADGTPTTVTVTIDGTNDIPEISGESSAALKEDAVPAVSGQLAVADVDGSDTHTWSITGKPQGQYGTLTIDQSGKWTYTADPKAIQALPEGKEVQETFVVQVDDGHGGTDLQTITVTLTGTNDVPHITGSDSGTVVEDFILAQVTGGKLNVSDADAGQSSFQPQKVTGEHGTFTLHANGLWTFVLANGNADVQALGLDEKLVETYTVKTADGTSTNVTVTILGTNDDPHISGQNTGAIKEDAANSASGQLQVADVDAHDKHSWSIVGNGKSEYGTLTLDQTGKWTFTGNQKVQSLSEGETVQQKFTVVVSDGHGGFDTKTITVNITGTNDVPVIMPHHPGSDQGLVVEDAKPNTTGGKLDIKDADQGEGKFVPQTNHAGEHGTFSIDQNGNWVYKLNNADPAVQALAAGETRTEQFQVSSQDGSATHTVTVTIVGTNDVPVVTNGASAVTEDHDVADGKLVTTGQVTINDVDAGQSTFKTDAHFQGSTGNGGAPLGALEFKADGSYTYTVDNANAVVQGLRNGESIVETYTVTSQDGTATSTITITINGTDDAPVIVGQAEGTVKEDVTLSVQGKLDITDADHDQSSFQAQDNAPGKHGTFSVDSNGNWTYQLSNNDPAVQALAVGQHLTEEFQVVSADGTPTTVTVTIDGTNDKPEISGVSSAGIKEDAAPAVSGQLTVADVDTIDTHTWSIVGKPQGQYGTLTLDQSGKWTYTVDAKKVQSLSEGEPYTETFTVKVDDGHGGTDTQVVTVNLVGTNDVPVVSGVGSGTVVEDGGLLQKTGGILFVNDADAGEGHVQGAKITGTYGEFAINAFGVWTYTLNNNDPAVQSLGLGEKRVETFTVRTADGTPTNVTVTILGTNDAPHISGQSTGAFKEDAANSASGQLQVADVDAHDQHSWSIVGNGKSEYGTLTLDQTGKWTFTGNEKVQSLSEGEAVQQKFSVVVSDGRGGFDTQDVVVTITGTNDLPVITPHNPGDPQNPGSASDHGLVTEDVLDTTGGKLDIQDADAGENKFVAQTDHAGDHGTFSIDENGNWTYKLTNSDPAVQALGAGQTLTEKFTVTSADGSAQHEVTVTIVGTNDVPVLSSGVGAVTEDQNVVDGKLSTSGQLTITDTDAGENHFKAGAHFDGSTGNGNAPLGTLVFNADGSYTYTVANGNPVVQGLKTGQSIVETYTVTSQDGSKTSTITITINGTDDGATITPHNPGDPQNPGSASDHGLVTEDVLDTTGGKLDIQDADAGENKFVAQTDHAGEHGTFSIDENGNWTYKLTNSDPAVQALGAGDTLTEKFTVTSADGSAQHEVTVTIVGTNDVPVLSSGVGAVTEDQNVVDGKLSTSGQLTITDTDAGENHFKAGAHFDGSTGNGNAPLGTLVFNADGSYTYTVANGNPVVQGLTSGQSIVETYTVTSQDGSKTSTITITINGTDDGATITPHNPGDPQNPGSASDHGLVTEDVLDTTGGKLDIQDADAGENKFVAQTNHAGDHGTFSIDENGNWTYKLTNSDPAVQALGAGQTLTEKFTVTSADGSAQHEVTVTIVGTNDVPVLSSGVGAVTEDQNVVDGKLSTSGQLTITDTDAGENHFKPGAHFDGSTGNGNAPLGTLVFNTDGSYTYTVANANPVVQGLTSGQSIVETYTVASQDGSKTSTITITINGTDDGATITPHSPDSDKGQVVEDVTYTTGGKLDVQDPDPGQSQFVAQPGTPGQHGTFTIDANGNWTYNLTNSDPLVQQLGKGETLVEKFTVSSVDGSAQHEVTVTIVGTNDIPTISGVSTGATTEDGASKVTGQLSVADVDIRDSHTWTVDSNPRGAYGFLTVDATGKWTYTVDTQATQALTGGQKVQDTFTVKVDDGHGGTATQTITVNITGTNDIPVITPHTSGSDRGLVIEDAQLSAQGKLDITDADQGQAFFKPQTVQDSYGTFTVDANGNWTYTLDNNNPAVQALSGNDTLGPRTFTVTSQDGTTTDTVTVNIGGTNDAPTSADNAATVGVGQSHTFGINEFAFSDSHGEHDSLQSVVITRTPESGSLTLNGQAVTQGQVISAADIAAGKLVYTPGADGKDASFGFEVRDTGGTANGGHNTSGEYNFDLATNNLVQGDNSSSGGSDGHGGNTPVLNGGSGDDIILGDLGGTVTTTVPGQNYNIALIVDHSGSMTAEIDGQTRMQLVKDALLAFVKTLSNHDGIINVTLIGFGSSADTPVTVQGLDPSDVNSWNDKIIAAINSLSASGSTNYQDAFDTAVDWFQDQASAGKGTSNGYQNLSFFLTDGDPTVTNSGGNGSSTNASVLQTSINSFADLAAISTVHGVGIGDGVNQNYLRFFDNTTSTGTATVYFPSSTNLSDSNSYNWDDSSNWTVRVNGGGSVSEGNGSSIAITDASNRSGATVVDSKSVTIAAGHTAHFEFELSTSNLSSNDNYSWALQQLVNGSWTTVQSGKGTGDITTGDFGSGQYRLEFSVLDNTSGGGTAKLTIDDITLVDNTPVSGPAGEVDIVHQASDLNAALTGGGSHSDPAAVGSDTINGGDGKDIIFGDTINTDGLSWSGHAAGTHDGQGMQGLIDYLTATNGHAPTSAELYGYISANHAQFNVSGDTRGGNDVIHGGNGDDIIYGQGGNDQLYGDAGNDVIYGGEGSNLLHGGAGNDTLTGGSGSDTLIGGQGNDTLIGGGGGDTFKWELHDQGTNSAPAVDTIKNFNTNAASAGGDVLDLHELLQNPADGDLSKYLHFTKQGADTIVNVSTTGHAQDAGGNAFDQKIVLQGVDLTNNGTLQDAAIINDLLQKGKLHGHD